MQIYQNNIKRQWIESSVLGTLWGSFEIIIGSFLHNIKFPMSGSILAFFTVILLTSYGILYNQKGIFLRASLIAALMKSISPSAVLLGPMTGIIMEGFLIEIAVFFFGLNIGGFIMAGIFALYSVLIHKIITLLIIYGFNIVKIFENFYYFLLKMLGIKGLGFWQVLGYLSLIYVFGGISAALIGYWAGKKALKINGDTFSTKLKFKSLFENDTTQRSPVFLPIFFHLFALIFSIWLISLNKYGILAASFYILLTAFKYKKSLQRLKKVAIWIQFVFLFAISALFYEVSNGDFTVSKQGIFAGIEMIVRAFVIIFSFSAISTHLRSPLVKIILFKNGFRDLYLALSLSFSALPEIINNFEIKKFLKNPLTTLIKQILSVKKLGDEFARVITKRKIYIITGAVNSGKTSLIKKVSQTIQCEICGFISEAKNKDKDNFYIIDLKSREKKLLCSKSQKIGEIKTGRYYFSSDAIEFGKTIIRRAADCNFLIIDEIGPLELKGKGWSDAIEEVFEKKNIIQIWIVRRHLTQKILKRFAIFEAIIFDTTDKIEIITKEIASSCNKL